MDVFTWTFLLETVVGGIIGNRVDAGAVVAWSAGWTQFVQGLNAPDSQTTRDELAMAVSRAFLWAQQSLVQECLSEVAQDVDGGFSQPRALPGNEAAVNWLNRKDKQLRTDLKQLDKGQLTALATTDTTALGNLLQSQDMETAFSQQLTTVVVQEQAPDIYVSRATAADTGLMARLAAYFEFELQTNQTVQNWFQTQLLLQINRQLQSVNQTPLAVEDLRDSLKALTSQIPAIVGQVNNLVLAVDDVGADVAEVRALVASSAAELALLVLRNGDELAELKCLIKNLLITHTSNQANNLDSDFLQLLWQKYLEMGQSENCKTQLYNQEKLDFKSVYVPAFLNKTCKINRIHRDQKQQKISLEGAIKDEGFITIIGPPGIGKSTILKKILIQVIERNKNLNLKPENNHFRLPVLIRLREVSDNGGTANIRQELGNIFGIVPEQIDTALRTGKFLILLDGLDEISESFRKRVCSEINSLSNFQKNNKIILSCRNSVTSTLAEKFTAFEVADLDKTQQEKFITNYFSFASREPDSFLGQMLQEYREINISDLIWRIRSNARLQELATSPLLLSMICLVYISTGTLPEKRSDIYQSGIKIYLETWDEGRISQPRHQSETYQGLKYYAKQELLEELAYRKFTREREYIQFSKDEIVISIAERLKISPDKSYEILMGLSVDHGLLTRTSLDQWEFSHLTFQEFFVAKWISSRDEQDFLIDKILEEKWREVIRLVIELKPPSIAWFMKSKVRIDNLVASEDSLQRLLNITSNKVKALTTSEYPPPYKEAAMKAFYYELGLNFSQNLRNRPRKIKKS